MNIFQRIGRFAAGRVGGTKAVAKYDAAPADKKDDVVVAEAEDLAKRKIGSQVYDRVKAAIILLGGRS